MKRISVTPTRTNRVVLFLLLFAFSPLTLSRESDDIVLHGNSGAVLGESEYDIMLERALRGADDAALRIADHFLYGAESEIASYVWLRFAAQSKGPKAQEILGSRLLFRGDERAALEAVYWLTAAARANVTSAQRLLGQTLAAGKSSDRSGEGAVWLEAAAPSGDVSAAVELVELMQRSTNDDDQALAYIWAVALLQGEGKLGQFRARLEQVNRKLSVQSESLGERNVGLAAGAIALQIEARERAAKNSEASPHRGL